MTPDELIATLQARGISLAANGDRLKVDAPAGTLTAELRDALAQHKAALIARLMDGSAAHSNQDTAQLRLFDNSTQPPARPVIDDEPTCQPPDEVTPVIDPLITVLDCWEQADDPADPSWRHLWAQAEIDAGLPCFEIRQNARGEWFQIDAGPDGWRRWASRDTGTV